MEDDQMISNTITTDNVSTPSIPAAREMRITTKPTRNRINAIAFLICSASNGNWEIAVRVPSMKMNNMRSSVIAMACRMSTCLFVRLYNRIKN